MPGDEEASNAGGESQTTFYMSAGALLAAGGGAYYNNQQTKLLDERLSKRMDNAVAMFENKFRHVGTALSGLNVRIQDLEEELEDEKARNTRLRKEVTRLQRSLRNSGVKVEKSGSRTVAESESESEEEEERKRRPRRTKREPRGGNRAPPSQPNHDYERLLDLASIGMQ